MLSCAKGTDERYYMESSPCVKQPKEQPVLLCPPIPSTGDEVVCDIEAQNDVAEGDSTTEGSIQSIDSDESGSALSENYEELSIAYTKHQLILLLMRDVYAKFSSQWQANVKTRTTPEEESSRALLDSSKSTDSSKKNHSRKRASYHRDRSQGDGNDEKRKKTGPSDTSKCGPDLQLACPFHKYDPTKYCPNIETGVKYRACSGPGFPSVSRLK